MGLADWWRRVIDKMFPKKDVEKVLQVELATSTAMEDAIRLWTEMYCDQPPWATQDAEVLTLNLPAAIAEEMARLTLTEFDLRIGGSERGEFIDASLDAYRRNLPSIVEQWAAMGGIVLKPYPAASGTDGVPNEIRIDTIPAVRFFPTEYSNGTVTGAVFVETKRKGGYLYTRLETHGRKNGIYSVSNRAFRSERITESDGAAYCISPFREEVQLTSIDEWAMLAPDTQFHNLDTPLFVYVRIPRGNNIEIDSPLGVSVYSRATEAIKQADEQYSRIVWEYKAKEAAVFADQSVMQSDADGNPIMDKRENRLFRLFAYSQASPDATVDLIRDYSPDIRDDSMFNGLNQIMRKIELQSGLAYGTLSEVTDTAKTATEIRLSKQRSFSAVSEMQHAWEHGIDQMIHIMDTLCTMYKLCPSGKIEITCTWGDGIIEDADVEFNRRFSMVSAGLLRQEFFVAWYLGVSEEEALKYIPGAEPEAPDDEE